MFIYFELCKNCYFFPHPLPPHLLLINISLFCGYLEGIKLPTQFVAQLPRTALRISNVNVNFSILFNSCDLTAAY